MTVKKETTEKKIREEKNRGHREKPITRTKFLLPK